MVKWIHTLGATAVAFGAYAAAPPSATAARPWIITLTAIAWVVGLVPLARKRPSARTILKGMRVVGVLVVVFYCCVMVTYIVTTDNWTVDYDGRMVLVGGELTDAGKAYFAARPDATASQALFDAAGEVEELWTPESLSARRWCMWAQFVPLYVIALAAVVFSRDVIRLFERSGRSGADRT